VPVLKASTRVVARASNRIFVGAPLCRDLAYLEICIGFTRALIVARLLLGWFPKFLKPYVPCPGYGGALRRTQARRDVHEPDSAEHPQGHGLHDARHRAAPCARRRTEHGAPGRSACRVPCTSLLTPHGQMDILSWMIEHTKDDPVRGAARSLVIRLLALNFAAIHTSSLVSTVSLGQSCARADRRRQTFTHALYTLAAHPEYIAPLREEAEAISAAEGLTKTSLLKLTKLDSFLRESTRVNTFNGRKSTLARRWRRRC
jgi:hypothetical protein